MMDAVVDHLRVAPHPSAPLNRPQAARVRTAEGADDAPPLGVGGIEVPPLPPPVVQPLSPRLAFILSNMGVDPIDCVRSCEQASYMPEGVFGDDTEAIRGSALEYILNSLHSDNLPLRTIRKFARKTRDYLRAYADPSGRTDTHSDVEKLRGTFKCHRGSLDFDFKFIRDA